jgi:hypothetical protein
VYSAILVDNTSAEILRHPRRADMMTAKACLAPDTLGECRIIDIDNGACSSGTSEVVRDDRMIFDDAFYITPSKTPV